MIIVGVPIGDELKYLLDSNGNEIVFESVEEAKEYLMEMGMLEEEMYYLKFIEVEEEV